MQNSVAAKIINRIGSAKQGWVFTAKDFVDLGTRSNVDFILHNLTQKQIIYRIGRGIYNVPIKHPKLGTLSPAKDDILRALSSKTGEIIQPSGAEAANWLGLSTQVPARPYSLTSGQSRMLNVGNSTIKLKHTRIRPLHGQPDKASLVIQALLYMGKEHIDNKAIQICSKQLSADQKDDLLRMAAQVPGWLTSIIHNIAA